MHKIYYYAILYLCFSVDSSFLLSCKDENNNDVDWFFLYKFPKIFQNTLDRPLSDGTTYVYITSKMKEPWTLSKFHITSKNSLLGKTWENLKKEEESSSYLFYNDETPSTFSGTAVGHLKGFLAFNEEYGFWMIHSIPGFGVVENYDFPESGIKFGQYALCVTYRSDQLNNICEHLLYCNPNIYQKKSTENVLARLSENAKTIFTDKPAFIHHPPFLKISELKSRDGQKFIGFAKDNQLVQDLYSDILAPELETSLLTETWKRGSGTNLDPSCEEEFTVVDVTTIHFSKLRAKFKSNEDHSKWAVSSNSKKHWICCADLNRMESQKKRGGGAVCFQSSTLWRQLRDTIEETDKCPTKNIKNLKFLYFINDFLLKNQA